MPALSASVPAFASDSLTGPPHSRPGQKRVNDAVVLIGREVERLVEDAGRIPPVEEAA
jgi:hypothetical protein